MTIQGISDNVQALLENSDLFSVVIPANPDSLTEITGYPAAMHYYSDGESQFATVSQNRRVFEYNVDLVLQTSSEQTSTQKYAAANSLIDATIDIFDKSIDLSSVELDLPRACDIMRPAPSTLQKVTLENGEGLLMTIKLFCEADITFRNS